MNSAKNKTAKKSTNNSFFKFLSVFLLTLFNFIAIASNNNTQENLAAALAATQTRIFRGNTSINDNSPEVINDQQKEIKKREKEEVTIPGSRKKLKQDLSEEEEKAVQQRFEDNVRQRFLDVIQNRQDPLHYWNNINAVESIIPVLLGGPLANQEIRRDDPFIPSQVIYDNSPLERGGSSWRGRINDEDIEITLGVIDPLEGDPQIDLHLDEVQIRKSFEIQRPANLNIQTLCQCQGWPQVEYSGLMENGSHLNVRLGQMHQNDQLEPSLYALSFRHVLYGIDSIQNRLGIFCEFTLSGFGSRFELINQWDLNNHGENQPLEGIFYDGTNIYDTLTTPAWFNNWTHAQLTPVDRERLIVATLHKSTPRDKIAINPDDFQTNQEIPTGRYTLNGGPDRAPARHRLFSLYSDGNGLFLASCFRQVWNSTLEVVSYNVEYFCNTTVPQRTAEDSRILPMVGGFNAHQQWQEGLYLQEQPPADLDIWRRVYSNHGPARYRVTPNHWNISRPQRMDDAIYLEHLSYNPMVRSITTPCPQNILQLHIPRITDLRRLAITNRDSKFSLPRLITLLEPLQNLEEIELRTSLLWQWEYKKLRGQEDGTILGEIGRRFANFPNLRTLRISLPPVQESYANSAASSVWNADIEGDLARDRRRNYSRDYYRCQRDGIESPFSPPSLFEEGPGVADYLMGAAVRLISTPLAFTAGACVDGVLGTIYVTHGDHNSFANRLGYSRSLQNITFYCASPKHDKNKIREAVNLNHVGLPPINVTFEDL